MISRVYVDNFKCFVNSDIRLQPFTLLVGENGSGKTALLEVVEKIKRVVLGEERIEHVFSPRSRTRWETRTEQTFELEIDSTKGTYVYKLVVNHHPREKETRIEYESLRLDKRLLFESEQGDVQLYRDDFSEGPSYPFDWGRSALATVLPREDNEKLSWFKNRLAATYVIRLYPPSMTAESVEESRTPTSGFENFVSWYRHVSQEHPEQQLSLFRDLEDSLDGFERLKLSSSGASSRILEVVFSNQKNGETIESTYRFDELSDGQRAIVVLYALIRFAVNPDTTVFIDEPGNYLGLDEIQPWLLEVEEASSDAESQVALVSHHPELIDELALDRGTLFYRENAGPARTRPFEATSVGSIRVSERMARGWLDG